jgi:tetratricopeptide (TPR) repeat protein
VAERIDGWKAIGAYFGRDRTTAMRWAETRALPVHRVPGGKKASVYALRSELEAWLGAQANPLEPAPSPTPEPKRRHWPLVLAGLGLLAAASLAWWATLPRTGPGGGQLPADPEVAQLYLQARDDWAQRSSASINRAIGALGEVTRRDPKFPPAHASLAEAFLLAREFGAMSDGEAFPRARAAARQALRLDAGLQAAHRAEGFILYWWDHRPEQAGAAFRRALALAPRDAQTHFWYGNALADNGAHAAGLRELNAARLIEPGSVAIQTDFAWAAWSAGGDDAKAEFERLRSAHPDFAVIHESIGVARLAEGDYAGYVDSFAEFARLRGNAELLAQAGAYREALGRGLTALQAALMRAALEEIAGDAHRNHAWPAFLASTAGNRAQLVALLRRAAGRSERWGAAGIVSRIARRWGGDAEVAALLAKLRQPPME